MARTRRSAEHPTAAKRSKRARNAIVGFALSRFIVPAIKKRVKARAAKTATGVGKRIVSRPGRTTLLVGVTMGAIGWLLSRRGHDETPQGVHDATDAATAAGRASTAKAALARRIRDRTGTGA